VPHIVEFCGSFHVSWCVKVSPTEADDTGYLIVWTFFHWSEVITGRRDVEKSGAAIQEVVLCFRCCHFGTVWNWAMIEAQCGSSKCLWKQYIYVGSITCVNLLLCLANQMLKRGTVLREVWTLSGELSSDVEDSVNPAEAYNPTFIISGGEIIHAGHKNHLKWSQ